MARAQRCQPKKIVNIKGRDEYYRDERHAWLMLSYPLDLTIYFEESQLHSDEVTQVPPWGGFEAFQTRAGREVKGPTS